jgi:hypothetical protein
MEKKEKNQSDSKKHYNEANSDIKSQT